MPHLWSKNRLRYFLTPLLLVALFLTACDEEGGEPVGYYLNKAAISIKPWVSAGKPFPNYPFESILTAPGGQILVSIHDSGIFISTNTGVSWNAFSQGLPDKLYFRYLAMDSENSVYGADDTAVYKRRQSGEGWTPLTGGLPKNAFVNGLYVNSTGAVYLTSAAGLFMLNDSRTSWNQLGGGLPSDVGLKDLAFNTDGSAVVLTAEGKMYRSQNGVSGWRPAYIPYYAASIYSIESNQRDGLCILLTSRRLILWNFDTIEEPPQLLYAEDIRFFNKIGYMLQAQERSRDPFLNATKRYTLMRSVDAGKHWAPFYTGLGGLPTDIAFTPPGDVYPATSDGSFFNTTKPVK